MLNVVIEYKEKEVGTLNEYFTSYPEIKLKNKKTGEFYPGTISFEIDAETNEYKFFTVLLGKDNTYLEKKDITQEVDNSDYELVVYNPILDLKNLDFKKGFLI